MKEAVGKPQSSPTSPIAGLIRFGNFEVDTRTGELRRGGIKLKLSGQPFDVMVALLEKPGQVVTREELHDKLWSQDTFVDFEHGLNKAINKVREALGDDADNPRFIETLPRRGYRFIAPVEAGSSDQPVAHGIPAKPSLSETVQSAAPVPAPIRRRRIRALALGLAVVVTLLIVLTWTSAHKRQLSHASAPHVNSLAVLPLANLSGDPGQDFFADGMTEALITDLGKISALRVISRTSVVHYKGTKESLPEIARELNVDALIEGTVSRSGNHFRITANLLQASPEKHLWAESYESDVGDVLALEGQVAQAIAREVQVKLTPEEKKLLGNAREVDPQAHDDYLRGEFFLYQDLEYGITNAQEQVLKRNLETAVRYFRQAIEKDPDSAPAHARLAESYIGLATEWRGGGATKDAMPRAKAAAEKAVELDPSLGQAHFSLAQVLALYDWNWSEADKEYRLSLKLDPNYADAHLEYGRYLQDLGRDEEAITHVNYALELDPFDFKTKDQAAYVTWASRQYDIAIKQFENLGDDLGLAWSYREKNMYPQAIAAGQRSVNRSRRQPFSLASLACAYGLAGKNREARELINELKETARQGHISSFIFVEAYLGLGERDQALTWLERAYEDRDEQMVHIKSDPRWDALRSEPRFQALLRRMNFPQ